MDPAQAPPPTDENDLDTVEQSTSVEGDASQSESTSLDATNAPGLIPAQPAGPPPKLSLRAKLGQRLRSFNIYLLLFLMVLLLGGGIAIASYLYSKNSSGTTTLKGSSLSQSTLNQLATSDATVGSNSQVLNVQSSAIFAGKVLVRSSLAVAGDLQVGGSLALTNLAVSGNSVLDQVQIAKDLAVTGDTALQGQLSVRQNLAVTGDGTFNGTVTAAQLATSSLQLNGDLNLTHHITAGGATPSRANGTALGSGGTSSVSGSDTSGTLSVNTGSNPAAGCYATITFATKFNATPHVIITPVGSAAAGLSYYVDRSASNFSICSATPAAAGANFAFDYLVLD